MEKPVFIDPKTALNSNQNDKIEAGSPGYPVPYERLFYYDIGT